ncbi:MAG: hypothetical protein Q7T77_11210 [Sulfuricurvum sp.]|nr:hypothetical protein [Sulfuricurvum sp.]
MSFNKLFIIVLFTFLSIHTYAAQSKGYKIVLASFPTLDEAKAKLAILDSQLGADERAIQEKYHYEIVARSSGKAFILAIEPLETKVITDQVIKQFGHLYPDAYSNGYFGPTEGALVLEHTQIAPVVEEANRSIVQKVEKRPEVKAIEVKNTPVEDEEKSMLFWIVIAGISILMAILLSMFKRRIPTPSSIESKIEMLDVNNREEIVSEAIELPANVPDPSPIEAVQSDIFYRLKKNMFFITILKELKDAADAKDTYRCHDLMREVLLYQKNFRKSNAIATMDKLLKDKNFSELSAFISNEIN